MLRHLPSNAREYGCHPVVISVLKNYFLYLCTNNVSHNPFAVHVCLGASMHMCMCICMFVCVHVCACVCAFSTYLIGKKKLEQLIPLPSLLILFLSPTLGLLADLTSPSRVASSQ